MILAFDVESTGLDVFHTARPFFVTTCDDQGNQNWYEWPVDPLTRKVDPVYSDVEEIVTVLDTADEIIGHNVRFDVRMIQAVVQDGGDRWKPDWGKVHDTLIAAHLLHSNQPKDLTSLGVRWLGHDQSKHEEDLARIVQECRRKVQQARLRRKNAKKAAEKDSSVYEQADPSEWKYADWRIAEEGLVEMPSAKEKCWRADYWLPATVADAEGLPDDHEYRTCLREYANSDSAVTALLWPVMRRELERRGLWKLYEERRKLLPLLSEMRDRGVTLNGPRLTEMQTQFREESAKSERVAVNIAAGLGHELQLPKNGVNNNLRTFCFDVLKLEPVRNPKAKTDAPSLDAKNALPYYKLTLPPTSKAAFFLRALESKRARDTGLAYLDSYIKYRLPITNRWLHNSSSCGCNRGGNCNTCDGGLGVCRTCGRAEIELSEPCDSSEWSLLYPDINPTGSDTLRVSVTTPNTAQISKKEEANLRRAFGPGPGREWWSIDYKNIERRLPAYETGETDIIALFEEPDRPPYYGSEHLLVAHLIFPREFEGCRTNGELDGRVFKKKYAASLYQRIKNFDFSVQYMAGESTADRTVGVKGAYVTVKSRFSKQEDMNRKLLAFANKHGYVETMPDRTIDPDHGYPLLVTRTERGKVLGTLPFNYRYQGSATWVACRALVKCHEQLAEWRRQKFDGFMPLYVHDEIVFDLPKRAHPLDDPKASNLGRINVLRELMASCGADLIPSVPTPTGAEYHPESWGRGVTVA